MDSVIRSSEAVQPSPAPPASTIPVRSKEDLWEKALQSLKDEDKRNIQFEHRDKLEILKDILETLEVKKAASVKNRWKYKKGNKQIIIHDQLEKIIAWVIKFKEVGDLAVQYDPVHAALPWAGVRFFLQIPENYFKTNSALLEGIESVSNLITRCSILENVYLKVESTSQTESEAQVQLSNAILKLYIAVLKFFSKARQHYDRRTVTKLAKSVIQTPSSSIDSYITSIDKNKLEVEACARLADASRGRSMHDNMVKLEGLLQLLDEPISRSATRLDNLYDHLKEADRRTMFKWLSQIQYRQHHKTVGKDFLQNSCHWLIEKPEFVEWKNESCSSMLWLHGIPGSGKTKLVYSVIEHLKDTQSSNPSPPLVAYFYCARNQAERERANPDEILRSILKQLSCSKPTLPIREPVSTEYKALKDEADEDGSDPTYWTASECVDLIIKLLQDNPAMIIVDALDECDPDRRHEILLAFDRIIQDSGDIVKIFASSRDDDDIVCRLETSPNVFIRASDNGEDIDRFVHFQVNNAIAQKRLLKGDVSLELKDRIIRVLTAKAGGMLRWVELQIQNLCDFQRMKHENDIYEELGRLPTTLKKSYDLMYQQITRLGIASRQIVKRTLIWLLCAQERISTDELIEAVSMDQTGNSPLLNIPQLLGMCCNLVVLDKPDKEFETLRFAHLSVREYLEGHDDYCDRAQIHAAVLEDCLDTYLVYLAKLSSEENFSPEAFLDVQLSVHATLYWPVHCQLAGGTSEDFNPSTKLLQFLFATERTAPYLGGWVGDGMPERTAQPLQAWIDFGSHWYDEINLPRILKDQLKWIFHSRPQQPLFVACCFSFLWIFPKLEEIGYADWSIRDHDDKSVLEIIAEQNQPDIFKYLLSRDSRPSQPPLCLAAEFGFKDVVEDLLNNGADVNSLKGVEWGPKPTALQLADHGGHKDIVELLLDRGASWNFSWRLGGLNLRWILGQDN